LTKNRPALFRGRHFEDGIILLCVRWYLRYSLSYRDLEEITVERGLSVDHVTIWRWVQRFAPILNQRLRRELRRPNRSWRVDETYVRVAGQWTYLYRAVDSSGDTIDFMLSPKRDFTAAKLFLRLALSGSGGVRPRVVNVDGHPAYVRAIAELKDSRDLGRRCRCRPSPYLNNIIEQDHRFIKRRIIASLGFRSPRRMEDDRGLRGNAYDSERAGPMVGQGRRSRAAPIYSQPLWPRCVDWDNSRCPLSSFCYLQQNRVGR
jgi:transposase, IS6 family